MSDNLYFNPSYIFISSLSKTPAISYKSFDTSQWRLKLPIEIEASFTLEVDDYGSKSLYDILNNDTDTNFSISINGTIFQDQVLEIGSTSTNKQNLRVNGGDDLLLYQKALGVNIFNQSFNNVKLVSQNFNSTADDILSVNLSYKGYLNN